MRAERGFTLLEVLVAFIIAALALAALFEGGIGGLQASNLAGRYAEAISRAQSHLDAVSTPGALAPSDRQGDEGGGYHWRVRITVAEAGTPDPNSRAGPVNTLFAVSAAESWTQDGRTRAVQLDTMREGSLAPTGP